jgi:predicted aspartyl protease
MSQEFNAEWWRTRTAQQAYSTLLLLKVVIEWVMLTEQLLMDAERSQLQRALTASEPFIRAQLNENEISVFPDTGAAGNFMSLQYAKAHGLKIDRKSSRLVKLGNGSTVSTLGTTTSLFSFAGEESAHSLLFNVLRTSVYDVVLGSPFLKATETLTRYAHRIGRRCPDALSHRICALGTPQRVSGRLNGVQVDAVPDTGAEISLMSASFAAQQGFEINTDAQHCVLLEFADGSTANATGLVKDLNWKYGGSEVPCRIDVYVLPELSVDLLLGDEFLFKTDAFVAHEDQFWSGDDIEKQAVADEVAITWLFWIIKLVRTAVKDQRDWGSRRSSSHCIFPGPHELTQMLR